MEFQDRVSAYPNRYILTTEDGSASHVLLERADEPIIPGTPLNAETFNAMFNSITPSSIGAASKNHTHSPSSIGAAPSSHTHSPSAVGIPKYITESGVVDGVKYNLYNDGAAECYGEMTVNVTGGECNIYELLPVTFTKFDSVHACVLCEDLLDGSRSETLDHFSRYVHNIDAEVGKSRLVVRILSTNANAADISNLRLSIHVIGVGH
jgi:hypothetical protein